MKEHSYLNLSSYSFLYKATQDCFYCKVLFIAGVLSNEDFEVCFDVLGTPVKWPVSFQSSRVYLKELV